MGSTSRWVCPRCDREFDRTHQQHTCVPGIGLADTFAGYPEGHRAICEAIIEYVAELGPLYVDAVGVGVFLKSQRKLAEVRPKKQWIWLYLVLPAHLDHARVVRHIRISDHRIVHCVRLHNLDELDEQVRVWLTQAYHAATD